MDKAILNARLFDGERIHENARLIIRNSRVFDVGGNLAVPAGCPEYDAQGRLLAPGFVDLQVNGGGGVLFNESPTVATLERISKAHLQFGTTSFLPTLISDSEAVMRQAVDSVRAAIARGVPGVMGLHFEGPLLSAEKRGIHHLSNIRRPSNELLEIYKSLDVGTTLVTLAPECVPVEFIRELVDHGVRVWAGHTAGAYDVVAQAIRTGISGITHLFNGMPGLNSRAPGAVGAALDSESCWCAVIADGFHVHPATLRVATAAKKRGEMILVTDAMAPVGAETREFSLQGERIEVNAGRCLASSGSLAGSALDMMSAVRNADEFLGVGFFEALRMASTYPARAIGRADRIGALKAGCMANIVEIDEQKEPCRVWSEGRVLYDRRHAGACVPRSAGLH